MNHFEMKMNKDLWIYPVYGNDLKFVFKSVKCEKWFENCFQNGWSVENIYPVKIFLENN